MRIFESTFPAIDQNLIDKMDTSDFSEIAHLIDLGRRKSYLTIDDILQFFPEAELDVNKLEEVFAALLSAGIPCVEDDSQIEDQANDSDSDETNDNAAKSEDLVFDDDDGLDNLDIDDVIGLYLKEVGRIPLLSATDEVELARRIETGRNAREELAKTRLRPSKRNELQRLIEDGWAARSHLITANSRLVISIAKRYMKRGVPFQDLIQEGNIGLIRATKKFDYHRGLKFSTYATWWIRQAVTRAIADQGRTIRIPVHMGDQINKLYRMHHRLTQELGREPTTENLASSLDVPPKKIENLLEVSRRPMSLETPIDNEGDSVLGDFIQDKEMPTPDDSATASLLRSHLDMVLSSLPPREVRILQLRYGILDGKVYTLEQVGRKMGVTRERVRQIEAQALSRLRHPTIRRSLSAYLQVP